MKQQINSAYQIVSSGRQKRRVSAVVAIILAAVLTLLFCVLAYRLKLTWEIPVGSGVQVSERTRDILAETRGVIRIICFMDRRHAMYRPVSRLLRGLTTAARSVAGAKMVVEYVDPRWELTRAGQLASMGVAENTLVFMRQRRKIMVPLDDMLRAASPLSLQMQKVVRHERHADPGVFYGEAACAAAISRLALSHEQALIYWLQGHGEVSFDEYDDLRGFSDIAREIRREGFELRGLSLAGLEHIPKNAHVLVIAGARFTFATEELNLIDLFLQNGGRLLYLATPGKKLGIETLLEQWGIHLTAFVAVSPRTLSGRDVVISGFADHVITRNLKQAAVVFGQAACLDVSTNTVVASAAQPCLSTILAQTDQAGWGESTPDVFPRTFDQQADVPGPVTVAAVSERGGHVAKDVVFKPTRVCVIGDTDFVMNGVLATRANANRDFFMNALTWLAGIEAGSASSMGGDATLVTGFERRQWIVFILLATFAVPIGVLAFFQMLTWRQRR